jgi:hypothetical protein
MSIVALKRKSFTQYGRGHVDAKGVFSLNGTYRHPPPSLGRPVYPTPMKGSEPKGHGCGRRCRVPGRYARICGSSYPVVVHHTCETVQTAIHPSVKNTSARLATLHLGINPVARTLVQDMSSYTKSQLCLQRQEVDEQKKCTPCVKIFKEMGPISYTDRLTAKTTPCILANP